MHPSIPTRLAHVRTAVSQQLDNIGVVVLRRREQRREAHRIHSVYGSLGRALEDHAHDARVPVPGCYYEGRTRVVWVLESLPA